MSVEVQPGQIWADNDKRSKGRTLRVEQIFGDRAICTILTNDDVRQQQLDAGLAWTDKRGDTTRISLRRFKGTFYRLLLDPLPQEVEPS